MRKKLKDLNQLHGKIEDVEVKSLDQIWGEDGSSKYKTLDQKEYEDSLKEMNTSDLNSHASRIGLIPVENRELLIGRLISEFKKHVSMYKIPKQSASSKEINFSVKKILSEGK